MRTIEQVDSLRDQLLAEGTPKPDTIRQIALACMGWPYVFGAWGEQCSPSNRRRRMRDDHPTIKSKCQVLSGKRTDCNGCQWYPEDERVRMYDCRGWTRWLLQQVGLDIVNSAGVACQTVTNQYNAKDNWLRRGPIDEMPDCVCNVFDLKNGHTGMHIGGGIVIDCSVNVRSTGMKNWTNYAVHKGLYREEDLPVTVIKATIRKGSRGQLVTELQDTLTTLGYDCGNVDGIYGTKTCDAVKRFQKDWNLEADGICGPKTWQALYTAECQMPMAPGEPQLYTVICRGMTWDQSMKLREICPTAEMQKE